MKMNSILKGFLVKYFPAIIFFIVKNYFSLDFINDFNPFSSETKDFFNGKNPQGSSINPEEVKEVEGGVVVSGETLEEIKAFYEKNLEFF